MTTERKKAVKEAGKTVGFAGIILALTTLVQEAKPVVLGDPLDKYVSKEVFNLYCKYKQREDSLQACYFNEIIQNQIELNNLKK